MNVLNFELYGEGKFNRPVYTIFQLPEGEIISKGSGYGAEVSVSFWKFTKSIYTNYRVFILSACPTFISSERRE